MQGVLDAAPVKTEGTVVWGEPYLALSVADVRGIVGTPAVTVNGVPERMVQGADSGVAWKANLRVPIAKAGEMHGPVHFAVDINPERDGAVWRGAAGGFKPCGAELDVAFRLCLRGSFCRGRGRWGRVDLRRRGMFLRWRRGRRCKCKTRAAGWT